MGKTALNKSAPIQPERLKNLLRDLVDIYSPSGKEEEILRYTEEYLKKQGLYPIKQERCNLIVLPQNEQEVDLCFVGHLDTIEMTNLPKSTFYETIKL